jgi:hypothetical protein
VVRILKAASGVTYLTQTHTSIPPGNQHRQTTARIDVPLTDLSSIATLETTGSLKRFTVLVASRTQRPCRRPGQDRFRGGLLIKRHDPFIKPLEGMQCELRKGVSVTRGGLSKVKLGVVFGVDDAGRAVDRGAVWRRQF